MRIADEPLSLANEADEHLGTVFETPFVEKRKPEDLFHRLRFAFHSSCLECFIPDVLIYAEARGHPFGPHYWRRPDNYRASV